MMSSPAARTVVATLGTLAALGLAASCVINPQPEPPDNGAAEPTGDVDASGAGGSGGQSSFDAGASEGGSTGGTGGSGTGGCDNCMGEGDASDGANLDASETCDGSDACEAQPDGGADVDQIDAGLGDATDDTIVAD